MSSKQIKEYEIAKIILNYTKEIETESSILKGDLLSQNEKEFVLNNPNAFLIGLISDQSVKAELAWSLPYKLSQRLNTFDLNKILKDFDTDSLEAIIKEKPALHRYPNRMAMYIYEAIKKIITEYSGNAQNIWDNKSAKEIVDSLEQFKGISHKKASLGTLILIRDLNANIIDKENVDIAYDIHIRRLFLRLGLVDNDIQEEVLESAKRMNPKFPGELTTGFWHIGREICRPTNPSCLICPLFSECNRELEKTKSLT